ncbi:RBP11-like subunits of RNA polymerase [Delitschia confertaspora ATCC 74209]|uniref:DNA-directed RNA polymerases I and III subunit RPAC1 n=1 Tax=Delitschia confertaspora ATCC 74209 TaxID=1513339 RepID=A0A9P4MRR3_9PLEO|nr:RBP11-like subunits of RNA polymerase [Delitschia confertaspora ATCC 74209]
MVKPTQKQLEERRKLGINQETVTHVTSTDFPGHWPGEDHSWDLDYFRNNLKVDFHSNDSRDASFSVIGLDASIANAFRRIMIAEIPTIAIDQVFMYHNTSIIQDEVLASRIGLIPFKGKKSGLQWMQWYKKSTEEDPSHSTPSDFNIIMLKLDIKCEWQEGGLQRAVAGETDPDKLYINHNVYAKHFTWEPVGAQEEMFGDEPIAPVHPDILIAKMRPGQRIYLKCHAIKGIGADHAKFSPVATASYRLMPTIDINSPIVGADAKKFMRCFPKGVIALQSVTAQDVREHPEELQGKEGEVKAVVDNPMKDTVSRECLRHEEFKDKVKLGRLRDHFIFRVESTGQWESDALFLESVRVLKTKAERVKRGLNAMMR